MPQQSFDAYVTHLNSLSQELYYSGSLQDAIVLVEANVQAAQTLEMPAETRARLLMNYVELLIADMMLSGREANTIEPVLDIAQVATDATNSQALQVEILLLRGQLTHQIALSSEEGDFAHSLEFTQPALQLCRELDNTELLCKALFWVGLAHQFLEETEDARTHFEEACAVAREHHHRLPLSYSVRHLGFLQAADGDLESARASLEESLALREELQFLPYLPFSHISVAEIARQQGDVEAAHQHLEKAASFAEDTKNQRARMMAFVGLGQLADEAGDDSTARANYQQALEIAEALQHAGYQAHIGQLLAELKG
ncbi:MAG: hypothetical protein DWQ07_07780 [Chloroflexi bacterium]|nr:MAG: hypothetical protein DWQ07_07780 [Chloroflexota bacterium]MBL1197364.1 hypothetical protein [Chloroflexota bacterium]NOH14661.1 tetratricopeptide repeat protein [Chloroflexota bacterium]